MRHAQPIPPLFFLGVIFSIARPPACLQTRENDSRTTESLRAGSRKNHAYFFGGVNGIGKMEKIEGGDLPPLPLGGGLIYSVADSSPIYPKAGWASLLTHGVFAIQKRTQFYAGYFYCARLRESV